MAEGGQVDESDVQGASVVTVPAFLQQDQVANQTVESTEEIINCYEKTESFIESLEGIDEKFLERIAEVQMSGQPYVMKYVVEALMEAPEDEEPIALTEEDIGYLFILFKTVVDLLDETLRREK